MHFNFKPPVSRPYVNSTYKLFKSIRKGSLFPKFVVTENKGSKSLLSCYLSLEMVAINGKRPQSVNWKIKPENTSRTRLLNYTMNMTS